MSASNTKRPSRADWKRIEAMRDGDIDFSDIPPLDDSFFQEAVLWPGPKKQITLRLDPDVLDFFKGQGRGYQRNINAVLRRYMQAQKHRVAK
jgi:uncharacterized protein (DUF4415 family)